MANIAVLRGFLGLSEADELNLSSAIIKGFSGLTEVDGTIVGGALLKGFTGLGEEFVSPTWSQFQGLQLEFDSTTFGPPASALFQGMLLEFEGQAYDLASALFQGLLLEFETPTKDFTSDPTLYGVMAEFDGTALNIDYPNLYSVMAEFDSTFTNMFNHDFYGLMAEFDSTFTNVDCPTVYGVQAEFEEVSLIGHQAPSLMSIGASQNTSVASGTPLVNVLWEVPQISEYHPGEYLGLASSASDVEYFSRHRYIEDTTSNPFVLYEVEADSTDYQTTTLTTTSAGSIRIEFSDASAIPIYSFIRFERGDGKPAQFNRIVDAEDSTTAKLYYPITQELPADLRVSKVWVNELVRDTDYELDSTIGYIKALSGQLTDGAEVFALYKHYPYDLDHFELWSVDGSNTIEYGAVYSDVTSNPTSLLVDGVISSTDSTISAELSTSDGGKQKTLYLYAIDEDRNPSLASRLFVETIPSIPISVDGEYDSLAYKINIQWASSLDAITDGVNIYRCNGVWDAIEAVKLNNTPISDTTYSDGPAEINRVTPGTAPYPAQGNIYSYKLERVALTTDWTTGTQNAIGANPAIMVSGKDPEEAPEVIPPGWMDIPIASVGIEEWTLAPTGITQLFEGIAYNESTDRLYVHSDAGMLAVDSGGNETARGGGYLPPSGTDKFFQHCSPAIDNLGDIVAISRGTSPSATDARLGKWVDGGSSFTFTWGTHSGYTGTLLSENVSKRFLSPITFDSDALPAAWLLATTTSGTSEYTLTKYNMSTMSTGLRLTATSQRARSGNVLYHMAATNDRVLWWLQALTLTGITARRTKTNGTASSIGDPFGGGNKDCHCLILDSADYFYLASSDGYIQKTNGTVDTPSFTTASAVWSISTGRQFGEFAHPVLSDTYFIIFDTANLELCAYSRSDGSEAWSVSLDGDSALGGMTLGNDGVLHIPTEEGNIYYVDSSDGSIISSISASTGALRHGPILTNGLMIVSDPASMSIKAYSTTSTGGHASGWYTNGANFRRQNRYY